VTIPIPRGFFSGGLQFTSEAGAILSLWCNSFYLRLAMHWVLEVVVSIWPGTGLSCEALSGLAAEAEIRADDEHNLLKEIRSRINNWFFFFSQYFPIQPPRLWAPVSITGHLVHLLGWWVVQASGIFQCGWEAEGHVRLGQHEGASVAVACIAPVQFAPGRIVGSPGKYNKNSLLNTSLKTFDHKATN
jgi:hypothetical protein